LHATVVLKGAFGIHVTWAVAIVTRVRVNNGSYGAFFTSQLGFDPSPGATVLGNSNFACDAYTVTFKYFIIGGSAIIYKNLFLTRESCRTSNQKVT
jgi:hypothetical protein